MLKPETRHHKDLFNVPLIDPVKNALLLGLNTSLIRTSYYDRDKSKCKCNSIAGRIGAQKAIKDLAKNMKIITKAFLHYYT